MYNIKKFKSCICKEEYHNKCVIYNKYKIIECSIIYYAENYTTRIEFRYDNITKKYTTHTVASINIKNIPIIEFRNGKIDIQYNIGLYQCKIINCGVSGCYIYEKYTDTGGYII